MTHKYDYKQLKIEIDRLPYGYLSISELSPHLAAYIEHRYTKGISELNIKGLKTKDNGYTLLLGVWHYTKSKGIKAAIMPNSVWMATLKNNPIVKL